MPFSQSQLDRIKAELGYNLLLVGADPYIGISQLFEQVVNEYIADEVITTSSTAVAADTSAPPVAIELADATGFVSGSVVWVDVDRRYERATIQSLSSQTATMQLSLAHSGTYPVTLEGPISIAKDILSKIAAIKEKMAETFGYGMLKKVDEIEFYNTSSGLSQFGEMGNELMFWRNELASILGVPNLWDIRQSTASTISVY